MRAVEHGHQTALHCGFRPCLSWRNGHEPRDRFKSPISGELKHVGAAAAFRPIRRVRDVVREDCSLTMSDVALSAHADARHEVLRGRNVSHQVSDAFRVAVPIVKLQCRQRDA